MSALGPDLRKNVQFSMLQKQGAAEEENPLTAFQTLLKEAVELLHYPDQVYELLKEPIRFLEVKIPVRMDDGKTKIFTGYRSQHNDAVGPTKGGIRFHPEVTADEVKALSAWMSMKCGITDLPYGGGKGGVVCDPRDMSTAELERLSRGYVRAISQLVGPSKDIPAPDVFTNAQIMAWMADEYDHIRENDSPGFITGKPIVLGGSLGRETATSKGVLHVLKLTCGLQQLPIKGLRVIIQGFGNVGSHLAQMLYDEGAKVVGIGDVYGAIYDEKGLNIPDLMDRRDSFGAVTNLFKNTITNGELLEKECDLLVPAALGGQITEENAPNLKCRVIVEAANGPTTAEATKKLTEKGVMVVPDILANSGGVIVSYFEWVQNNQGLYWTELEVEKRLKEKLETSFHKVYRTSQRYKIDMRTAAYVEGVRKVTEASMARGWVNRT